MHTPNCGNNRIRINLPAVVMLFMAAFGPLAGCAHLLASTTENLADGIANAILNQNDPETVRQGAPAYLLMIDGLIANNPRNEKLLRSGANLYASYAAIFVDDPARARRMTDRAWKYGKQALCNGRPAACGMDLLQLEAFAAGLKQMDKSIVPTLYTYGVTWAGWIESHQDNWNAVANVPKVEAVMEKIVALDEEYEQGGAHLYLGVLSTLLPPALGGRPKQALAHFDQALELSHGRNLMVKVVIAERYARPLFEREMHDRLLGEVLAGSVEQPGFTLMNVLAKERARSLLDSANEYF